MYISKASPQQVTTKRLDADFYRPDYLSVDQKLSRVDTAHLGICGKFFAGPFGSKLPSNLYLNEGVPLFRVGNVGQFEVLTENLAYLAPKVHEELISSEVIPGDILIVKASVGEKIAKVPDWMPKANITQHIIGVRPNGVFDSDFICAFLYSELGRKQLERFALGSIIQYLGVNDARSVLTYRPAPDVQKYIGDKVRQAERLRAWAKHLERSVKEVFEADIQWDDKILRVPSYGKVGSTEIEGRLDLKFNSPQRISLKRHFNSAKVETDYLAGLVDISAMIGWKGLTTEFYRDSGPWLLRGVEFNDGIINTDSLVCVDEFKYLEQPQIHLKENDVAFSKDGTIGKAVVIPLLPNRLAAGSTIARLRIKDSESLDPYYLEFALGHPCVQVQVESFAPGIAQPHITQEWIARLEIPRIKSEEAISDMWRQHHAALSAAKGLTKAAKQLVESLIDWVLAEQQLIDSQKALESDDNSLDREILGRLTTKGLDGDGDPLFADLDQLYDLLAQCQQMDE